MLIAARSNFLPPPCAVPSHPADLDSLTSQRRLRPLTLANRFFWLAASLPGVVLFAHSCLIFGAAPDIGKAEAQRRSMLALMGDNENPVFAHPAFWAPFAVLGEGGTLPSPGR